MALKLSFNQTDIRVALSLKAKNNTLMDRLVPKMTYLMSRLQQKAQANINSKSGDLAAGIQNPRAKEEGNKVIGELDWGLGASEPYARVQEYGGIKEMYAINPKAGVGAYRGGFAFGKYREAHPARAAKQNLAWVGPDGKWVYRKFVFHPKVQGQHFMANAVEQMRQEFITELKATVNEVIL